MGDIWTFVEERLNATVPAYFKNVLNVCGYSNGISISLIEAEDLSYIENEVKSGNIVTAIIGAGGEKEFLKDCTKKAENFEFVLGHKKFLLAIANFLKNYIAENGAHSLILDKKSSKNSKTQSKAASAKKTERKRLVLTSRNVDKLVPLVQNTMKLGDVDSDTLNLDSELKKLSMETNRSIVNHQVLKLKTRSTNEDFDENQYNKSKGLASNLNENQYLTVNSPIENNLLKVGKYVIYCMSLKSWICWPNVKPPVKHFVGQVCISEGTDEKNLNSEIELTVLKKSPYNRHHFGQPENDETIKVSKKNVLQILQEPIRNRRDEFVFEDKSLLDYTFG